MGALVKQFRDITIHDVGQVGGKNASLGEMFQRLAPFRINIPNGFATTSEAFWDFIDENKLAEPLQRVLSQLDTDKYSNLSEIGQKARNHILNGKLSPLLSKEILNAYKELCKEGDCPVAVRSSATAEDLPDASFAGQHDTFLNIVGGDEVLRAVKKCFSSLYTDRAIKYRDDHGFEHHNIALSVGVQHMVRTDKGCSGVGFTIEPESGFQNIILLSGVWGLGENIVQGTINPDEFYVFKPTLKKGLYPIVQKKMGDKKLTMIYSHKKDESSTVNIDTPEEKQNQFILKDSEIIKLANWAKLIEEHYQRPMDIEWAKDGISNKLFILQARPETVHKTINKNVILEYTLLERGEVLTSGRAVGSKIKMGKARLLQSPKEAKELTRHDIIVTDSINPDWDPLLKQIGGIITNKGGRTSHAAIVARELGVPAIVGCGNATGNIKDLEIITMSCAEGKAGYVYQGSLPFKTTEIDFSDIRNPSTETKLILADPEKAFDLSFYPNDGVGLLRMEFIIAHLIKVHPMALIRFDEIADPKEKEIITKLTRNYPKKEDYFVDQLSQGIATIAAGFYPKEVIVRLSDFKTNEYANLIGGKGFEPNEENPMLGFRGAARYYSDLYKEGFALECAAIKRVRDDMGLDNLKVMVPFCRTLEEGEKVVALLAQNGLVRGQNGLQVYTMVEIPSNVILAEEFAGIFDGFSIGSNDLTQLTLGIDRDSEIMGKLFDENNQAAKRMIAMAIESARRTKTKIGLCGQAPSDFPDFAQFLVEKGIDSISFNPDALLQGIDNINKAEAKCLERK